MYMKILKSVLLILGLSSAIACIVLNIYLFNNPWTENAQSITQISYFLLIIPIPIALLLDRLRKPKI